jgi:malonyl-CoA/methylmalonyl-CoA synthetase
LHFLPLHHVHGAFNMLLTPLAVGARVDFCAFEPLAVWERLCGGGGAGETPTVFMGVPTAYSKLLECFDPARHSGARRLRLFVCGSAPLPAPLFERFEAATTHRILERWGMTEVGMGLSNPYEPASRRLPGFVGLPMPGVQARLELDDGGPPPAGEPGNLLVRGPQVFSRYWGRDPEQTRREEFREGGWFRTGDVALYDPALDSYKIVGRASVDIIKVAGYKVSAVDVERELLLQCVLPPHLSRF